MDFEINVITPVKRLIRPLFGAKILGLVDYFRFPNLGMASGGPFNGQVARQRLFWEIITKLKPQAIVETGTHLGTTTEFMAETDLPVYTIELDSRRFGFCRARFWQRHNITLLNEDSRRGLRKLISGPLRDLTAGALFFYLDAHWNADLPLAEEIDLIFDGCPAAIVMIDDFQVPSDTGYGYDDYGPGKTLAHNYIARAISRHVLQAFYPSTPSCDETGWRRGCLVLTKHISHVSVLDSFPLLYHATEPAAPRPFNR
jgi:hypothetical protein